MNERERLEQAAREIRPFQDMTYIRQNEMIGCKHGGFLCIICTMEQNAFAPRMMFEPRPPKPTKCSDCQKEYGPGANGKCLPCWRKE